MKESDGYEAEQIIAVLKEHETCIAAMEVNAHSFLSLQGTFEELEA